VITAKHTMEQSLKREEGKQSGLLSVFTLSQRMKKGTTVSTARSKFPYGQTAHIGLLLSRSIHY
jgi:hypothetical protein